MVASGSPDAASTDAAQTCAALRRLASWAADAGDLVFVPRDTPHDFTVMGQAPARYLLINSPPGFAREVAQAPSAQDLTLPPPGT